MTETSKPNPILLWGFVPLSLYLAGFFLLWFPLGLSFSTHYWTPGGDGFGNVWNIWWFSKAVLEQGSSPWFTDQLFHPDGLTLLAHTLNPFNGFLGMLLGTVLSPVQVFNFILAFSFVASGYTCFLLAYELTRSYCGSLLAGSALTFSSYHFAHALGHTNLIAIEWIPMFVLMWVRLLDAPSIGRGALAALAFFLVLLCDYYYTLYCATTGFLLLVHRACRTREPLFFVRPAYLKALGVFAVLAVLSAGAIVFPLLSELRTESFTGSHDPVTYSADLFAPLLPGGAWRFAEVSRWFSERLSTNWVETDVFLGWTVLALAIYSWLVRKRAGFRDIGIWILLALIFFVLSLGPVLHVFGTSYPAVPMPYHYLAEWIPFLELGGMPVRMMVMVLLFTSVAAAYGCTSFFRRVLKRRWAMLIFLLAFVIERIPYPLPTREPRVPDYIEALAKLPPGAVDGLSAGFLDLFYQTRFDKPMTLGWAARVPRVLRDRMGELESKRRSGQYRELFDDYDVRYFVRPRDKAEWPLSADLKPVFVGQSFVIYALADDPLPVAAETAPFACDFEVTVIPGTAASATTLVLRNPAHAGEQYRCLFSLGTQPPILLTSGRWIPLQSDTTFQVSVDPNNQTFIGNHGRFDENGEARISIRTPQDQDLTGTRVHFSVTLVDPTAQYQLGLICESGSFILP